MREEDLDLTEGLLRIPMTKTKTPRTIYLPDVLVKALLKMKKALADELDGGRRPGRPRTAPGVVWPSSIFSGSLRADGVTQMLGHREKEAGISLGAHAWRRKFAGHWQASRHFSMNFIALPAPTQLVRRLSSARLGSEAS